MTVPLPCVLAFLPEVHWSIPVVGLVAASLAFVVGRRFVAGRAVPPSAPGGEAAGAGAPAGPTDVFLHGSATDRRSAPRRKGNSVDILLAPKPEAEPIRGWVVDRSVGGLCLQTEKPVPQGSVMQVRPRSAPDSTPWTAVEIKSCRPDSGEWEVGCRFVKTPQWNVLLLFG
jgi:hypothetical protein